MIAMLQVSRFVPLAFVFIACSVDVHKPPPGAEVEYTEEREPCADRDPFRNLYFGELHAHTGLSFDAWAYGTHAETGQALDFARGQGTIALPPLDDQGKGTVVVSMPRPLDFAAITDHQEYLGELNLCLTEGSDVYDVSTCAKYREGDMDNVVKFGMQLALEEPVRMPEICGSDDSRCIEAARVVWAGIVEAAEDAYDRTPECAFTAFPAFEYTNSVNATNLHRNLIFRNARVPDLPPSYFEKPSPWEFLMAIRDECLDAGTGCDAISIPHNSNWSNGRMFQLDYSGDEGLEEQREMAEFRARMEPIVEIFQHKGDSECDATLDGLGGIPDPLCDFEKQRLHAFEQCGDGETGFGGMSKMGCVSRLDFVRNVLKAGIEEQARLGINPYMLGIIGSTDTHNAIPGLVEEHYFHGHVGTTDDSALKRLGEGNMTHHGVRYNPGGLAAVWAVENSRDAIFEALRRREVYGTSGTRLSVRMFGGWDFGEGPCGLEDRVARAYDRGVPMGSGLPSGRPEDAAPVIWVWAREDPGYPGVDGTPLQRIQVVKGWVDADGASHEKVFDIAGDANSGASVDLATCETSGPGFHELCAVWKDPDFDPDRPAFYYSRVLENPVCRWSVRQCNSLEPGDRPESCSDPDYYRAIQERAWTSPIWFVPGTG